MMLIDRGSSCLAGVLIGFALVEPKSNVPKHRTASTLKCGDDHPAPRLKQKEGVYVGEHSADQ